jgi:cytochrome c-type biogenesis protein CcmH
VSGGIVTGRVRAAAWVLLAVVVAVALGFGASRGGAPPTAAQRAASIDAMVRCPSCQDISVEDSSASTALAIRQAVLRRVRAGQSDASIESFLVSRYGPGILLRPPAHGITAWVWILPPLALVAAGAGLATVFWRRRALSVPAVSADDRALVDRALADRAVHDAPRAQPMVRT